MAETLRNHRDTLDDATTHAADLLRDIAALRLTPTDIDELAIYLDDSGDPIIDEYCEQVWAAHAEGPAVAAMPWSPGPHDRIKPDDGDGVPDDVLDEVVLTGVTVHLERMDDRTYALMIHAGSANDNWLNVTLHAPKGKPRRCEATILDHWGFDGVPTP